MIKDYKGRVWLAGPGRRNGYLVNLRDVPEHLYRGAWVMGIGDFVAKANRLERELMRVRRLVQAWEKRVASNRDENLSDWYCGMEACIDELAEVVLPRTNRSQKQGDRK